MIGPTVSHYRILEKLGGGGDGSRPKQRFIHEAQAASALQHDNICTIHDIEETEDRQLFICMDYYEGETLKKKIERGPLTLDEAAGEAKIVDFGLAKFAGHLFTYFFNLSIAS